MYLAVHLPQLITEKNEVTNKFMLLQEESLLFAQQECRRVQIKIARTRTSYEVKHSYLDSNTSYLVCVCVCVCVCV